MYRLLTPITLAVFIVVAACDDGFDSHDGATPQPPPAFAPEPHRFEPAAAPPRSLECEEISGTPCGVCGHWSCTAGGPLCDDPGLNACGSCAASPTPGATCAGCGIVACSAGDVACDFSGNGAPCTVFSEAAAVPTMATIPYGLLGAGVALGDLDGDDIVDAVVGGADHARVLLGDGTGTFVESASALVGISPAHVVGVSLADFDGDADLDLLLTCQAPAPCIRFYVNTGTGTFIDGTDYVGLPDLALPFGAAWADFNADGWLDVYIAGHYGSALLRNNSGVGFLDVTTTELAGTDRLGFQPAWFDFDADGDQDLVVANDKGLFTGNASTLFRNDGGSLVDISASYGLMEPIDGMGVAVGDIDGDLDLDVYVTNVGGVPTPDIGQLLYLNSAGTAFVESAGTYGGSALDRYGWGAEMLDWDNDGDLDLAVATGTTEATHAPWLGENWGAGLLDVSHAMTSTPQDLLNFGLATADFDSDGLLDMAWGGKGLVAARFYRNTHPNPGHWLRVRLQAAAPNVHGIGATVFIDAGGERWMRHISAGGSFASTSEAVAHFGLGTNATVDQVEIWWPDGSITFHPGPFAADQLLSLTP